MPAEARVLDSPIFRRVQPQAAPSKDPVSSGFPEMKEEMALLINRKMRIYSHDGNCGLRGKTIPSCVLRNNGNGLSSQWSSLSGLVDLVEICKKRESTCGQ